MRGRRKKREALGGRAAGDLSLAELLLVEEAGYVAVGPVLGTSVFHIRVERVTPTALCELTTYSEELSAARRRAIHALQLDAARRKADGVMGVRVSLLERDFGDRTHELLVTGTAVQRLVNHRTPRLPFTCSLSGEDLWLLGEAGYAPVGLVLGACVYHLGHRAPRHMLTAAGKNTELEEYTAAFHFARETATERMRAEAVALKADGVVGVQLTERGEAFGGRSSEFLAIGTAVTKLTGDVLPSPPVPVLRLSGGRQGERWGS